MESNQEKRSDKVRQFISGKNGWLERWSLIIFCGILLILLAYAWFVKYSSVANVQHDKRLIEIFFR
jgi:hypothetical protein